MSKKKDFVFDPSIRIISGDSEEANEIYRELGWSDCAPKKDKKSYQELSNYTLWALLALLFTCLSCTMLNNPTWDFISKFLSWFYFFMYIKDKKNILPHSSPH